MKIPLSEIERRVAANEKLVADDFDTVGHKFLSVKRWNDKHRASIRALLCEYLEGIMFGDGLEREYLMDGVTIKGLNEMNDNELRRELQEMVGENDEDPG